ncbi:MAG TPA: hypothetical protein VH138_05370, partial [Vicinamibacterales bacterium]|nr:hypothetical protein [Vicinamibacterales bacterium]
MLAAAFVACAIAAPAQQQRKFTSGIDLVRVDALVTDGHSTISGLTASDFELRDNGVLQSIDSVLLESLPLSVTFVLNTSGSVNGIKLFNLERAVGAWLVHQSLTVIRVAFKDDLNLKPLLDRWRAEPWFTATAAMDRGLDLELYGAEFGLSTARR